MRIIGDYKIMLQKHITHYNLRSYFLTFNLLSEIEFYFSICKNRISSCFSKVKSKVKFLLKLLKIAIPISQGGADKYFFKAFKN